MCEFVIGPGEGEQLLKVRALQALSQAHIFHKLFRFTALLLYSCAHVRKDTYSSHILQAFMKGATQRLLHKIPANALFFVVYEFFRTILGVSR